MTANTSRQRRDDAVRALSTLEEILQAGGFRTRLTTRLADPPFLRVTNPEADALSENVTLLPQAPGQEACFAYSWGEPIGPVSQPRAPAERIFRLLATARS